MHLQPWVPSVIADLGRIPPPAAGVEIGNPAATIKASRPSIDGRPRRRRV